MPCGRMVGWDVEDWSSSMDEGEVVGAKWVISPVVEETAALS